MVSPPGSMGFQKCFSWGDNFFEQIYGMVLYRKTNDQIMPSFKEGGVS